MVTAIWVTASKSTQETHIISWWWSRVYGKCMRYQINMYSTGWRSMRHSLERNTNLSNWQVKITFYCPTAKIMTKYQLWQDENLVGYSRYTRALFHRTCHQWQLAIQWQLPWQQCFIANKNPECHFICHWMASCNWWQVLWNGGLVQTVIIGIERGHVILTWGNRSETNSN